MDCFFRRGTGGNLFFTAKFGGIRMRNKKGELTTQQLIGLIILIVSFGVILFLIFRLDLGETSKKEICHNSVLLKDKSLDFGSSYLDCTTSYICISGGGNCEGFSSDSVIKIDMSEDIENQVMEAIADEMADCWWMFGEGEVNYKGTDWDGYHCAICSDIKFDSALQTEFDKGLFTYEAFYDYLANTKKSDSQTYLRYLYEVNNVEDALKKNKKIISSETIYAEKKYSVITGLNPNWPLEDSVINPYFIVSNEVTAKTECNVFDITKS